MHTIVCIGTRYRVHVHCTGYRYNPCRKTASRHCCGRRNVLLLVIPCVIPAGTTGRYLPGARVPVRKNIQTHSTWLGGIFMYQASGRTGTYARVPGYLQMFGHRHSSKASTRFLEGIEHHGTRVCICEIETIETTHQNALGYLQWSTCHHHTSVITTGM